MLAQDVKRLRVTFGSGAALLEAYFPNGILGGILVDTAAELPLGSEVLLDVHFFAGPRRPFRIRARVAWRRLRGSGNLRAGVGLEFLPTERTARDQLLAFARGEEPAPPERSSLRVPADIKVTLRDAGGQSRTERSGDLSEGGIFVRTPDPTPVGDEITVAIRPPLGLRGFEVRGRVTWHRGGTDPGMGLAFLFDDDEQRAKVKELVTRLRDERAAPR